MRKNEKQFPTSLIEMDLTSKVFWQLLYDASKFDRSQGAGSPFVSNHQSTQRLICGTALR